jgi:hypothetical protein
LTISVDGFAKCPSSSPAIGGTGVGVVPGGFTPPGGGGKAILRLVKKTTWIFYELVIVYRCVNVVWKGRYFQEDNTLDWYYGKSALRD